MARIRRRTAWLGSMALTVGTLLVAAAASAQSLSVQVQPTRTRGVAPLAVLFDATGTRAATASDDAFHDLQYTWDFGDPGSGAWGPSGKPRNEAFGPVAGHVFERAGTYTVRVTVRDAAGRSASRSVNIVVDSADTLQTYCFANDNSDWSDPTGACQGAQRVVTSNFAAAMANVAPGRRLLFRRGDRFDLNTTVGLAGSGPVLIGAFGSGTSPIVNQTAFDNIFVLSSLADYRIADLDLRGTGRADSGVSTYHFQEGGSNVQLRQLTLLRITGAGQHNAINFTVQWGAVAPIHEEVAVVDCVFHNFADSSRKGSGVRLDVNRSMFLGNQLIDNERNEFNMRTQHLDRVVISHNFMDRPADQKGNLTIRGCNWFKACGGTGTKQTGGVPGVGDTTHFIVSDNHFRMRMRGAQVTLGPQNKDSFEIIRQALIERNLFDGIAWTGGGVQKGLGLHASDITVRNNIFDSSNWWSDPTKTGVTRTGVQVTRNTSVGVPDPDNVRVVHNTFYDGSSWPGGLRGMQSTSGGNHQFVNNLVYAPSLPSKTAVELAAGVVREQANLVDGKDYNGNPFASSNQRSPLDFRLSASSPVRDAGVAERRSLADYAGSVRPSGSAPDVGAFEVAGQGGGSAPAAPVLLP